MYKIAITDYVSSPAEIEKEVFESNEFLYLEGKDISTIDLSLVEVLLVWHQKIDKEFLSFFPDLKIIVRYGVGFDNIDLETVKDKGIVFSNTPDYGTEEVADTACAMILNATRKISYYDLECRDYTDGTWQENYSPEIKRSNKTTIGIIGVGRIGTAVVNRMKAFGFNIIGFDPYQPSGHEKAVGYQRVFSLDDLLEVSDVVSLHCPCNSETEGIISNDFVKKIKSGAVIINTARGKLLESLDVIENGLKSNQLAAVFLDVLSEEPADKSHSLINSWILKEKWLNGRLIINPHSAFYSKSAWHEMRYKCAETGKMFIEENKIRNQIGK
jgi:D-3-phosphoglycerate dehydrogenase